MEKKQDHTIVPIKNSTNKQTDNKSKKLDYLEYIYFNGTPFHDYSSLYSSIDFKFKIKSE